MNERRCYASRRYSLLCCSSLKKSASEGSLADEYQLDSWILRYGPSIARSQVSSLNAPAICRVRIDRWQRYDIVSFNSPGRLTDLLLSEILEQESERQDCACQNFLILGI